MKFNLKKGFLGGSIGREYRLVLVANCLIALLLSILEFSPDLRLWLKEITENFVFAQSIGSSIYATCILFNEERVKNKLLRFLTLGAAFIVGGWIGILLAWGINSLLFGFTLNPNYINAFFFRITLFNVFIATVVYSFFELKAKLHRTVEKLAEKEVNEQRLIQLKTKAELEALRAKVNPHFLFNTLNSIASLIPVDPGKAEAMVQKLSRLFRYNLDAGGLEMIKLKDELEVTEEYLDIEKVRLGNRLNYQIEMEESLADFLIPGFIIQPLVENSIKHGIAPLKSGGHINIHCTQNADTCQIEISDNGIGISAKENGNGFGLGGVKERLVLYYGDKYEFDISNEAGVRIRMRLPLAAIETRKLGKEISQ